MSIVPATPQKKASFNPTTPAATPAATRAAGHLVQASPHYVTTRRHSLYGTEDRIIIDPGSRIWKVGFSGEGRPRDVFYANLQASLWNLSRASDEAERVEEDKLLAVKLEKCLRSVFHDSLLTAPNSRKVILVEHPLLPLYIKDTIARILFDNLQVPSISFASSHLLSLFATGRITGLVLDCGYLESTALPIFAARPLFPQLRTTPLAGARLTSHLRALLLLFGTYLPPPTSLSAAANIPAANRATRVPEEVLSDAVIEEIKTRACFVGDVLNTNVPFTATSSNDPASDDMQVDLEVPSSDATTTTQSESDFSHLAPSSHGASSEFSVVSSLPRATFGYSRGESHLQALATLYKRHSSATELHLRVVPPLAQQTGTGRGTLIIPGWIRERAAEVLFEGGDVDESSVAEVILDALLKVSVDLRKTLASSILVVGGTPMLPGFIPRLHEELLRAISTPLTAYGDDPPSSPPPSSSPIVRRSPSSPRRRPRYDRYASLRPLVPYFAILNNPSPAHSGSERAAANAGKAPAFMPATMAWVGGSLAGSLKTGGTEVPREKWDQADRQDDGNDDGLEATPTATGSHVLISMTNSEGHSKGMSVLPDWTRMPLPVGAPSVPRAAPLLPQVGA